jgi:CRISPR-associated endonuclease Csn1
MTAYEYILKKGGSIVDGFPILKLEEYENHCGKYFKNSRSKLKKLLSEDIPEGFINRQLNDSRYISKLIKGLLSSLVREDNEQEVTSKHIVPVTGSITSKLKQDWGLNDKWNELIAPRFKRLNEMTNSNDFGYEDQQLINGKKTGKKFFRTQVPDDISKGFNKKRIDHRHHALDALVIACCTKKHTNYLGALNAEKKNYGLRDTLLTKNKEGHYTKHFLHPWREFSTEAKSLLEKTIISFKQNTRVINKTNNKTWQWVKKDGHYKKELVKQAKGDNWAIRKPLHEETIYGILENGNNIGKLILRKSIDTTFNENKIKDVSSSSIRKILLNHLRSESYNNVLDEKGNIIKSELLAFSPEGIQEMNKNILSLNSGNFHYPIYKVKLVFALGKKFSIRNYINQYGERKQTKYVKAATGTNLFFAIFKTKNKKGETNRSYEAVPFEEVIEHQKQVAYLPKSERTSIANKPEKGQLLFSLSPNDLVYVPTDTEIENPKLVDFENMQKRQYERIYLFVDGSGTTANFIPNTSASLIFNIKKTEQKKKGIKYPIQNEYGLGSPQSKNQKSIDGIMIKERCWKLQVDRLGNIVKALQ